MLMFQPLIRIIAFSCVSAFLFSSEAFALSREELERSVEEVTVRILERRCDSSPSLEDEPICWEEAIGTGTIVAKSFNTYYVLTARHVVDNDTDYTVRTVDQELRPAQPNRIVKLENDLAVIAFSDEKQYNREDSEVLPCLVEKLHRRSQLDPVRFQNKFRLVRCFSSHLEQSPQSD